MHLYKEYYFAALFISSYYCKPVRQPGFVCRVFWVLMVNPVFAIFESLCNWFSYFVLMNEFIMPFFRILARTAILNIIYLNIVYSITVTNRKMHISNNIQLCYIYTKCFKLMRQTLWDGKVNYSKQFLYTNQRQSVY